MPMKSFLYLCVLWLTIAAHPARSAGMLPQSWVRVNQAGYLPRSIKVAVFLSLSADGDDRFVVRDVRSGAEAFSGTGDRVNAARWGMATAARLDFSALETPGRYVVECGGSRSPEFSVGGEVYDGAADFLLRYMRQQRCGYNPYLQAECHRHDGYIVDLPGREGERIDVRGGWHDASDYLQYLPTSANATFQMLFAWRQNPDTTIFRDGYDAKGLPGRNGIPDILDEARWGLEWLARMNPDSVTIFNQIADDRDHAGMRLPSLDSVDYGWGRGTGRPVYFVTGRPQGPRYKNRTSGVASSAGKLASAFALGAEIFDAVDPAFASQLREKADPVFRFGERCPGNTQTICVVSPYFYEEDNYTDDMELAAAVRYAQDADPQWLRRADYWGSLEAVTPWMELGRARHYQYYPFVNLGHSLLARSGDRAVREKYAGFMRQGLERIVRRAADEDDPFLNGIPFIWCSNNLVAAALTQARLYHGATGDTTFLRMEAALRDWLFGCNPWGTSMICGYPDGADYPARAHSAYVRFMNDIPYGGLVDGPISRLLYETLRGIHLVYGDDYAPFQSGAAVYHDDPGDYSSNEPTMDGTASLCFYLSGLEKDGRLQPGPDDRTDATGAVVRRGCSRKAIRLIFSADSTFEGATRILNTLKRERIKGSFFLTGNCLRMAEHAPAIRRIVDEGHYLGGHSDRHLLYASWGDRRPLVTADSLIRDLEANRCALSAFGVSPSQSPYFLPPYEHCTADNVRWLAACGAQAVNLTPGSVTAADYTTPDMPNYKSSAELIDRLFALEREQGLDGYILLIHPGTSERRADKLYRHLGRIISRLRQRGYAFERF